MTSRTGANCSVEALSFGRPAALAGCAAAWLGRSRPAAAAIKAHRPYLRVRVGDYRVIYAVDDTTRVVRVAVAGHRREVYRNLEL